MKKEPNKSNCLTLILLITVMVQSFNIAALPVSAAISIERNQGYAITPRANIIKWRYKMENGKMYKRLFNYSTNKWIGKWERA